MAVASFLGTTVISHLVDSRIKGVKGMTEEEYSLAEQNMELHEALLEYSHNYIKAANTLPC